MLSNYFTYLYIAGEIWERVSQKKIIDIYSQIKNQLCVQLEGEPPLTVVVSCEPAENYLFVREGATRAKSNSISLLHAAVGKKIVSVECSHNDRIVAIHLDPSSVLLCEMFGSRANVFLCDETEEHDAEIPAPLIVRDSFLRKKENIGITRQHFFSPGFSMEQILEDDLSFIAAIKNNAEESLFRTLRKILPRLGTTLAKEAVFRSSVSPSAHPSLLTDREIINIRLACREIINDLLRKDKTIQPRIYLEGRIPVCFSLLPLKIFEMLPFDLFSTISVGVQHFISWVRRSESFLSSKQEILTLLEKEERKAAKTLEKIEQEKGSHNRAAEYELLGKIVMTNIHHLHKGQKTASLGDPMQPEAMYSIALDPALSPVQNAERYFEKAKKSRIAQSEGDHRDRSLRQRLTILRMLITEAAEVSSPQSMKQFLLQNNAQLKKIGYSQSKERSDLPPFRIFTVEGGFQVLAGKSSENNDFLTMKYAKPEDLWFHCRGASGSHVVLKVGSGRGEPTKKAITQAASIAAYYSKMKKASLIPVAMTKRKFVRKPKGVPAGTVTIEREKVLFVEAQLPEEEKP